MHQQTLWHECAEEALRSLVDALGGFKRVGAEMRPSMSADQAGRWLAQCLDAARPEKLALEEVLWLLKQGRVKGCHVAATFFLRVAGYKDPEPMDAETELQRLQREFVEATQMIGAIGNRMQALSAQIAEQKPRA